MDSVMLFIIGLFIFILILHKLDNRSDSEDFEVYHPTNYEMKPKLPCYNENLNFKCANEIEDLDNHYSNVCKTPTLHCHGRSEYTMARSLGRPRTCRRIID